MRVFGSGLAKCCPESERSFAGSPPLALLSAGLSLHGGIGQEAAEKCQELTKALPADFDAAQGSHPVPLWLHSWRNITTIGFP
jgi:hypothetical protein